MKKKNDHYLRVARASDMLRADYERSVMPGRPVLAGADQGLEEGTVEHTKAFSKDHSDLLQGVEKFKYAALRNAHTSCISAWPFVCPHTCFGAPRPSHAILP